MIADRDPGDEDPSADAESISMLIDRFVHLVAAAYGLPIRYLHPTPCRCRICRQAYVLCLVTSV